MFALNDIVTWTQPRTGNTQHRRNRPALRQRSLRGAGLASVGAPAAHVPAESEVAEETTLTDKK